eukprot:744900-Ditylum_brightwellii.AAC.1
MGCSNSYILLCTGSCPGIQAAPVATKGLAWQPKPQRRPRGRGSPKKPVWCRREQSGGATSSFWRGRALDGIAHRQGKCNM